MKTNSLPRSDETFFLKDISYIVEVSIQIRWFVGISLFAIPYIARFFNILIRPFPLIIIGSAILIYNVIFYYLKNHIQTSMDDTHRLLYSRRMGAIQIFFDYICLVVTLYFVGGMHTNLFYILIFHVIIGSMILKSRYMYLMVCLSILIFYMISLLEINNMIPYHNLYGKQNTLNTEDLTMEAAIHFFICMSAVYLISLLTTRIKSDSLKFFYTSQRLQENLESIKALELKKSKFMRYSAHQLRSPLATIISALNVLTKKMLSLDSERAHSVLNGAFSKAQNLLKIVNKLLELVRIREEKDKLKLNQKVNLIELIEKSFTDLKPIIKEKNITTCRTYNVDGNKIVLKEINNIDFENFPTVIIDNCNSEHLKHGFYNLIENAVKYSNEKGNIFLELIQLENQKPVIYLKDDGIGIESEFLNDIFLEFVRAPSARDKNVEGSGIGLSVVKEVFDEHNVDISVNSELSKGTEFTIMFR